MSVSLGIISCAGKGIEQQNNQLADDFIIPQAMLKAPDVLKGMRRADRFSKIAALAAHDAVKVSGEYNENLAIIVSTQFGPHSSTFKFLDDILEYGDAETSPTVFSHSVHNAAAHYVATTIGSKAMATTLTLFDQPFVNALELAFSWLEEGRAEEVLLGYVEERSEAMDFISNKLYRQHGLEYVQEFRFQDVSPGLISEGACFIRCSYEDRNILPVIANDLKAGIIRNAVDLISLLA